MEKHIFNMKRFVMAKAALMLLTLTFFVMGCSKPKPEVTTSDVRDINSQSAWGGGIVIFDVSDPLVEYGLCWGTQPNPEMSGNHKVADGTGAGTFSCEITGLEPNTTYYVRAYAINGAGVGYGTDVTFTTLKHGYVDLGLPSGTLWATCNVGAEKPEDYGDYFAWGEVVSKYLYDWSTYKYSKGHEYQLIKYCNNADCGYEGFTDNLITLMPEDDAATVQWGNGWCTPTKEQWQELYQNTTNTWMTYGRLFVASNGNSLYLPAAGFHWDGEYDGGSFGDYWSSSLDTHRPWNALSPFFSSNECAMGNGSRDRGQSVRPVRSAK